MDSTTGKVSTFEVGVPLTLNSQTTVFQTTVFPEIGTKRKNTFSQAEVPACEFSMEESLNSRTHCAQARKKRKLEELLQKAKKIVQTNREMLNTPSGSFL